MRNRLTNPSPARRTSFGLVAWLEETQIALPLKGLECSFEVCGDVVSVELDQVFQQDASEPLDCLYSFPLPAGAAVYCCEMHVAGRVIRAKVEERERARELAREKKADGYHTALVEMERDNLFTLSLGNVQPGEVIVIRFAWFQTLTRLGDWTSFHIPFCPGVRYIPGRPLLRAPRGRGTKEDTDQVPDASRISPPRIDRLHPDAAYVSVQGTVAHPLNDVKDISSPSHPVFVRPGAGASSVTIADRAAVPDSDFILRWTEVPAADVKPAGWWTRTDAGMFALVRLRAPADLAASDTYAQDVYFLIDRSGSMGGSKWRKAAQAFQEFVKTLGGQDRVWATFFESSFRDLAEKPLPPREVLADPAVQKLDEFRAVGGTELLPALEHVLSKIAHHSSDRPRSLVLITDGQVGNEAQILQRLVRQSDLRVHVFGIDATINDGFLRKLAAQHHGSSCLMSAQDDVVGAVARLGDRLRRPVLTTIRIPEGWELAGQERLELHAGEVLSLPLKRTKPPGKPEESPGAPEPLTFIGELPDRSSKAFRFELAATNGVALPLLWAKGRIEFLLANGETPAALALAKSNNLVCEGAAFIAWDETERVPLSGPDREVYQPAMAAFTGGPPELNELMNLPPRPKRGLFLQIRGNFVTEPSSPVSANNPPAELDRICAEAGHPEWLPKCRRLIDWAFGNSVQELFRQQRRRELLPLIELLKADVVDLRELFTGLFLLLSQLAEERILAKQPPIEIPSEVEPGRFDAETRQRLLASLNEQPARQAEISTLIAVLAATEKRMADRLDDFLRLQVEKTAEIA